ncbi:uncharacterized protein UBRO_06519 [Ustilago bromivora]|uniref:FAD-binding PCMH-type domain-containing protein n=1 Tax=Ustilago bromivora TaxID=307758 RepID=A0A1K0G7X0_9BASI|nr:uncharacterized protein UBRO_06519 [Ustilago bromivora]SYW73730.1 uncharacterized protein UBRO2_00005 [Ustilago bromivora]
MATATTLTPAPAAAAPPGSAAAGACSALTRTLTSSSPILLTPTINATSYSDAKQGGYNPLNNKLSPTCIIQPTTTSDVASAMKAIYRNNANYAVRAGGHTGMAGWDSVQGGVLIDFSNMRNYESSKERRSVTVQPGLRWGEVNEMSEPFGVAPMGGRVYHVGTGLILGGGLSLLSPQYGYACDGLLSAEVVMVDGSVMKVDAKSDPELLRAIKGGGARFGIVTKYELKAFPTGTKDEKNWYGGSITALTPTGIVQMIQATEQFTLTPDDPKATVLTNLGMLKQQGVPLYLGNTFLFYRGTQSEFEAAFKDFLSIPGLIPDLKPLSYVEAANATPLGWKDTQAYKWIGGSLYPQPSSTPPSPVSSLPIIGQLLNNTLRNPSLPTSWLTTWANILTLITKHEPILASSFWSLTPVKTTQINAGYANGGNALSPPPQGGSYMHYLFSQILAEGTDSFPADFEADRQGWIKDNPSSKGLPLFLNEVDAEQKTLQSYGWYEQLKKVYKKVDPKGFSVKHQAGPTF